MSQKTFDDKSKLDQLMAFCLIALSHYLSQCCHQTLSLQSATRPRGVNIRRVFLWSHLKSMISVSCSPVCSHKLMMTSSNGNIFRVTGHLCGEFTDPGEFPTQRPVTQSFDVFFDLRLNKRLSKQPWGWWFKTLSRPLWRHRNVLIRIESLVI